LTGLAKHFGIVYRAHDALEDARVAGEILALALNERRISIAELTAAPGKHITRFPISPASDAPSISALAAPGIRR
jgi:DNA polymerase III epsilon subunit-like protein